jgi:hypothetical protein
MARAPGVWRQPATLSAALANPAGALCQTWTRKAGFTHKASVLVLDVSSMFSAAQLATATVAECEAFCAATPGCASAPSCRAVAGSSCTQAEAIWQLPSLTLGRPAPPRASQLQCLRHVRDRRRRRLRRVLHRPQQEEPGG